MTVFWRNNRSNNISSGLISHCILSFGMSCMYKRYQLQVNYLV